MELQSQNAFLTQEIYYFILCKQQKKMLPPCFVEGLLSVIISHYRVVTFVNFVIVQDHCPILIWGKVLWIMFYSSTYNVVL